MFFGSRCFIYNSKERRNKFDAKVDESISSGYSFTSRDYHVLNKKSNKIEESYYVTFDDKYIKSYQKQYSPTEEISPSTKTTKIPLIYLYEDFLDFFDEQEKVISSKSRAVDNQTEELLKLINEAIENVEIHGNS